MPDSSEPSGTHVQDGVCVHYYNLGLHSDVHYCYIILELVLLTTRMFTGLDLFFSKATRRTVPENFHYYVKTSVHDSPATYSLPVKNRRGPLFPNCTTKIV